MGGQRNSFFRNFIRLCQVNSSVMESHFRVRLILSFVSKGSISLEFWMSQCRELGWLRKSARCSKRSRALNTLWKYSIFKSCSFSFLFLICRWHQSHSSLSQLELKYILFKGCCYIWSVIFLPCSCLSIGISFLIHGKLSICIVRFIKDFVLLLFAAWFKPFIRSSVHINCCFFIFYLVL